ncbi:MULTISPECIES: homoserine kinase [Deefgea]|uniref:Homoserine kinase n=1 Tax=Deefgea chitinilytica TaxID=570276 RepID=A0ABS2CDL8_9NEIS|nr:MULTISPECIES: homoserine kinase [Deefgea]MBM5572231.1 homoserine kinase [Deefgea chitinilytica]MBM9889466.1 homoserine kinase [Deefgea sp. CFH1-16]
MSVFTTVSNDDIVPFLQRYSLGQLVELKGISAGVTNTNYFVTTTHGRYVLTLFETLRADELPYYVNLMVHLAQHGIAVAAPIANLQHQYIDELNGKPTLLVPCLPGAVIDNPNAEQCGQVGEMLAQMHLAAASYSGKMDNPRGPQWWSATAQKMYPFMSEADAALLHAEVALQSEHKFDQLPQGVIHADLFRDNALMNGDQVGGFIDFYYACNDILLYDLAITLNDWCVLENGDIDDARARAMLAGYQSVRPLTEAEMADWPIMLRAAALRFWVSRLLDFYQPAEGEMTFAKDPSHFQRVIAHHAARQNFWMN